MPERLRLYLDQMLNSGHYGMRVTMLCELLRPDRAGQMTIRYCKKQFQKTASLLLLMMILEIGRYSHSANIQGLSGSK